MIEFEIEDFDKNIKIDKLADFTFKARKNSGDLEKNQTLESIRKDLEKIRDLLKFILISAYKEGQLIGYLLISVNSPNIGLIWDWQPVTLSDSNNDGISEKILKKTIDFSKHREINKIEVCFPIITDLDKLRYPKYVKWYESIGFYHVHREVEMKLTLEDRKVGVRSFPKEIEIKTIKDFSINDLANRAYEIFNNSKDPMFLDLDEEQKHSTAKDYFNPSKPLIEDASIVLTTNDQVIGFSVARHSTFEGSDATIGPFGITPNFRNKGLGEVLLIFCLNRLAENGFKCVGLDVSTENKPAYKLYKKVGFKKIFETFILAFNCK